MEEVKLSEEIAMDSSHVREDKVRRDTGLPRPRLYLWYVWGRYGLYNRYFLREM